VEIPVDYFPLDGDSAIRETFSKQDLLTKIPDTAWGIAELAATKLQWN
jgi:hypothetical protein